MKDKLGINFKRFQTLHVKYFLNIFIFINIYIFEYLRKLYECIDRIIISVDIIKTGKGFKIVK